MKKQRISEEQNKKLELICIIGLIIIALVYLLFTKILHKPDIAYTEISIYKSDKEIKSLPIDTLVDKKIIVYQTPTDVYAVDYDENFSEIKEQCEYNIFEISDKKIKCIESNCPNQVCVNHGALRSDIDNDMIVCAPHKLTIIYK